MKRQLLGLAGWIALCFVAGAIGAIASVHAAACYDQLVRPSWAPPAGVFGPVWTVLYLMMGVSAWLVWRVTGFSGARRGLTLFLVQLAANALWSWVFFAWHHGALALVVIVLLWILVLLTAIAFWRVRPLAGMLLMPYLAWVTFACALNLATWRLNPQFLG
ncbi:MAG: TspO/MBR family protein [Gammaproteobacteria bacterium]